MTDTDQEHLSLEVELSAAVETGEEQTAGETAAVKIPEDGGSGAEAGVLSVSKANQVLILMMVASCCRSYIITST